MGLTLLRIEQENTHTAGILYDNNKILSMTLEQPYRNNEKKISCIPLGSYICQIINSPKFGITYEFQNVQNRSNILFHAGNTVSDTSGCILLGRYLTVNKGSRYLMLSREAFYSFMLQMKGAIEFELEIKEVDKRNLLI